MGAHRIFSRETRVGAHRVFSTTVGTNVCVPVLRPVQPHGMFYDVMFSGVPSKKSEFSISYIKKTMIRLSHIQDERGQGDIY